MRSTEYKNPHSTEFLERVKALHEQGYGKKAIAIKLLGKVSHRPIARAFGQLGIEGTKASGGSHRAHKEAWEKKRKREKVVFGNKGLRAKPLAASSLPLFGRENPQIAEAEKERARKWYQDRYRSDPEFRLKELFKRRFRKIVRGGNSKRMQALLGCSPKFFRSWIESQFEDWMTWENISSPNGGGWQIDHVLPCAIFDHQEKEDLELCWNFRNLRPICAKQNMKKSSVVDDESVAWFLSLLQTFPNCPITTRLLERACAITH